MRTRCHAPGLRLALACTLALLSLLLLLLPVPLHLRVLGQAPDVVAGSAADPFGDRAVLLAPPQYTPIWSGQLFPATGFCLDEEEGRVLQNWSHPLYEQRIVMATGGGAGLSLMWAWIAKILVQELIGHQVWFYDSAASTDTFYTRLVLNPLERRVDIEIQSNLQATAPSQEYLVHVLGTGAVAQKGQHAHSNQGGIYMSRSSLERYPEYAMESWRAFTMGDNDMHAQPLYPIDNPLLQLFRNDSWKTLDSLRNVYGMDMLKDFAGQPVCQPVMAGRDERPFETGCNDPDFASMYIPPQCYPDPRSQCALIFATTPVWIGSYMQGQVRTLNLSLGIAFLNVVAFGQPAFVNNPAHLNLLMYSDGNQQASSNECAFGERQLRCWQRMQLPTYTSLCTGLYNGNYTSPYSCDFPLTQQMKYARPALAVEAPRVDHFLQGLDFNTADTFWFFQQPQLKTASRTQDHKSVACKWIREPANRARWMSWIAPPAACTMADTQFVVSSCDESTAEHTITYSWRQPKACVGGWVLPEPEKVSCGYATASLSWQVACMVVAGVLLFFHAACIAGRGFERLHSYRTSRRIAAQAEAAKASGAGKSHIVAIAGANTSAASAFSSVAALRRSMPIFGLVGSSFFPMHFGFLLLLLVPFVQTGPVNEARCWVSYSLTVGGVIIILQVLATLLGTLTNNLNRSLQANHSTNLFRVMAVTDLVLLVTLLVGALGDRDGLAPVQVLSPGGGSVWIDQCAAPVVWMAAVHVAICCVWAAFVAVMLMRALLRVYFSSLTTSRNYAALARQKTAAVKSQGATRVQLVQVNSIAVAFLVWLATSVLVLLPLYDVMTQEDRPENLLLFSSIVVLVGTTLCWLALFGPSFWRARNARKPARTQARKASSIAMAVTALSSGDSGGEKGSVVGTVSANTTHDSVNTSTNSDILAESVSDDREMTSVSLGSVLRDPILLLHLRRYAESNFDAEAVHFLLQCQALYRQLKHATLNLTQVLGGLESICDEFIVDGAPQQVNISSSLRDSTLAAVQDVRLSAVAQARNRLKPASAEFKTQARKCLHEAVAEVCALVQVNSYPRFLNSAALRRSQHLLHWADGFDELDDEEQTAMMVKLRDAQAGAVAAMRHLAEDNLSQSGAVGASAMVHSTGGSGRKPTDHTLQPHSRAPGSSMVDSTKVRVPIRIHDAGGAAPRLAHDQRPMGSPSHQHQQQMTSTTSGFDSNRCASPMDIVAPPSAALPAEPFPGTSGTATAAAAGQPADQLHIDVLPATRGADSHATTDDAGAHRPPSLPGSTED